MYDKKTTLRKQYKYNLYLMLSILSMVMGAGIFGGIALYNVLKLGDLIDFSITEPCKMLNDKLNKKKKTCTVLINISILLACLNVFLTLLFIWGSILIINDYMNAVANYYSAAKG